MKLTTLVTLLYTLVRASSTTVHAEAMGDSDVGDVYTWYENTTYTNTTTPGNSTTNSTTNSSAGDVAMPPSGGGNGGGGVPAPASGAAMVTWQATVATFAAAAIAVALV